jgi:alpha-galactosidase
MPEKLKVVLIGAASPQWGFTLIRDLIVTLSDEKIVSSYTPILVLEDIDLDGLKTQMKLALKINELSGNKVIIKSTNNQKKAIEGARFILTSFAVGSLEAMQYDLEIPQEYGIFQPVGDTISIGGAIRLCRNASCMLSIARDIENIAHSDAWLLNLSNPMSMLCRLVTKETKVKTIGCCHELYGGLGVLSRWLNFPYKDWRKRLEFDVLGINHCGFMQYLKIDGEDGFKKLREFLKQKGITEEVKQLYNSSNPELTRDNVKINLFLKYGVFPYSGDRHTSEFFKEFVNKNTNKGADYGILLTTAQERLVAWRGNARKNIKELLEGKKEIDLNVSQEAASKIIMALLLDLEFYDVGNFPYYGDNLPDVVQGAVIERMCRYNKNGVIPNKVKPLPKELHKHLVLYTQIIEDIVQASITGEKKLLIKALERDLLLQNMKKSKIKEMVERLLDVHREYVNPKFFKS